MKTSYFKSVIEAFQSVGATLTRKNNGHDIYLLPDNTICPVPRKLDNSILAKRLAKRAGVNLRL